MSQQFMNADSALENAGNDQDLVRDLAEVFVSSSVELLDDLQSAFNNQDHECLARTAHTLKSPLGFFGAEATLELARNVETQADAGTQDGLAELVDRLLHDVQQVRQEVGTLCD